MRCTLTSFKRIAYIELFCNSTHTQSFVFIFDSQGFFWFFSLNFTRTGFELYLYVFQEVVLYLLLQSTIFNDLPNKFIELHWSMKFSNFHELDNKGGLLSESIRTSNWNCKLDVVCNLKTRQKKKENYLTSEIKVHEKTCFLQG